MIVPEFEAFKYQYAPQWESIKSTWIPGLADRYVSRHDWASDEYDSNNQLRAEMMVLVTYVHLISVEGKNDDMHDEMYLFAQGLYQTLANHFTSESLVYLPTVFEKALAEAIRELKNNSSPSTR